MTSPGVSYAGQDCLQSAFNRKLHKYQDNLGELSDQRVAFKLLIWSTEGAPQPVALRVMSFVSDLVTRRDDQVDPKDFLRRWQHQLGAVLQ